MSRRPEPTAGPAPIGAGQSGARRRDDVLVVMVAVFLAYNANNGLPFVPTRS